MSPRSRVSEYALIVAVLIGASFMLGFGISTMRLAPADSTIYLSSAEQVFYTPRCFPTDLPVVLSLKTSTLGGRPDGYRMAESCRGKSFMQEGRSLTGILLERVGLLPPLPGDWDAPPPRVWP